RIRWRRTCARWRTQRGRISTATAPGSPITAACVWLRCESPDAPFAEPFLTEGVQGYGGKRMSRGTRSTGRSGMSAGERPENLFPEIEDRLRPLAIPLGEPREGDWLAEHREKGQTFRGYVSAHPVRRDRELNTLYLCRLGDLTD